MNAAVSKTVRGPHGPLVGSNPTPSATSEKPLQVARLLAEQMPLSHGDLLVSRIAASGARVEPIQAQVTGGGELLELAEAEAVALMPAAWDAGDDAVLVEISEQVDLPLLVLWRAGDRPPALPRLRAAMATPT
jgi:hypothetical protein